MKEKIKNFYQKVSKKNVLLAFCLDVAITFGLFTLFFFWLGLMSAFFGFDFDVFVLQDNKLFIAITYLVGSLVTVFVVSKFLLRRVQSNHLENLIAYCVVLEISYFFSFPYNKTLDDFLWSAAGVVITPFLVWLGYKLFINKKENAK